MGDNVFASMMGWLCFCWLVPLVLFGFLHAVVNALSNTWRNRGLERHELYCIRCRFNLRGNGSRQCPECGHYADAVNILSKGYTPPMTSAARMLIVTMACIAPMLLLGLGVGHLFAFNFEVSKEVTLAPKSGGSRRIYISRDGREGWPYGPEACTMQLFATGGRHNEPFVLTLRPAHGIGPADRLNDVAWAKIERAASLDTSSEYDLSQRRHDALRALVASMDRGGTPTIAPSLGLEISDDTVRKRYSPHPIYLLIVVIFSACVWICGLVFVGRCHRLIEREDAEKRNALIAQLDRWIRRNRNAMK